MTWVRSILFLLAAFALPRVALAQNHITPALVAETKSPRAGSETTLAFVMRPAPGWHGYWKNPGDAGLETRVAWTAPKSVTFGPLQYPVPGTLLIAGLMNYVYEGEHALLVSVKVPAGLQPGTKLPVSADLDWLACDPHVCVPEKATLALDLVVGDGAPADTAAFDRYRAALPRPLGSPAHYAIEGGRFRLEIPFPAGATVDQPYFFSLTDGAINYSAPQTVARDGDRVVIETAARDGAKLKTIDGVLRIGAGAGVQFNATPGTVTPARDSASEAKGSAGALLFTLGAALLGGLLLNIMPCVFPILSLKALSLARAGESEHDARIEALAYTAGVVLVCGLLGAALLAIRAGGVQAGWAFQLQDPRVIAVLMLLVLAIGLNLAGLFELPVISAGSGLASAGGIGGAFWTGALAAFVATPCAGPFLGTALGAAVLLPAVEAMAIFVGLGLGLALPFLAIGFIPALRARMPRPGAWMDTFRHILAVPMLVTALGLAWVLGRQAAVDGMTIGLGGGLLLALGLWWTGRRQAAFKSGAWWPALPALIAALALTATVQPASSTPLAASAAGEPFSETRLAALRAEGRPVFLYFTADWCLTCKVNEKAAIEREETEKAFKAKHVAVMIGDWTKGDPAITRFLSQHGRSGVPFYLFYPAGGEPRELPQVLTPSLLASL